MQSTADASSAKTTGIVIPPPLLAIAQRKCAP
jgi:hypothetical protein